MSIDDPLPDGQDAVNGLRLQLFLAMVLERLPLLGVAQLIEATARMTPAEMIERLRFYTWHHHGLRSLVADLAARLQPEAEGRSKADIDQQIAEGRDWGSRER